MSCFTPFLLSLGSRPWTNFSFIIVIFGLQLILNALCCTHGMMVFCETSILYSSPGP